MTKRSPIRKLQDPVLIQELEDALTAGEALEMALPRLNIHPATLTRELKRDPALGRRLEDALRAASERVAPVRSTLREDRVVLHDWLPALLVLVADIGIAVVASKNPAVVGVAVLLTIAYLAFVWRLWRVPLPTMRAYGRGASPLGEGPSPSPRDRPRA